MGEMIVGDDTTDKANLIPLQGYPGEQEHQTCNTCENPLVIKEVIWESHSTKRVSLRCEVCDEITVTNKEHRMFRHRIHISKD